MWHHIDASHLGVYSALEEYSDIFKLLDEGHSININGHKSLGTGNGVGFFWSKPEVS